MPAMNGFDSKYAPTAWRDDTTELQLPSGQFCLVRKISLAKMMADGILEDFDSLTGIVQEKHVGPKSKAGKRPQDRKPKQQTEAELTSQILADPDQLKKILRAMDQILLNVVVAPVLLPAPDSGEERSADPNVAYVDWVSEADKAYVFNFVMGGVKDLERFRDQLTELGDGMDADSDLEAAAE